MRLAILSTQYKFNQDDQPILHAITLILDNHLKEWYGDQAFWDSRIPEIQTYTNSFLLRFPIMTSEGKKHILVKVRRHSRMRSLTAAISDSSLHVNMQNEYRTLKTIYDFFGGVHSDIGAVRPLMYLENWSALVMEEYQSISLRRLLTQWGTRLYREESIKTLQDAAKKTGRWLHLFHHEFRDCSYAEPAEQIMGTVQSYVGSLESITRGQIDIDSIHSMFADKMSLIETSRLPVSQTHGDMTCDNILYSKERQLCAIDVKGKVGPTYADLGLILIHPETFKLQIFTLGLYFDQRILKAYRKAILEGYFGNDFEDELLLSLYCALMLLDKWVRYEDNASRHRGVKGFFSKLVSPLSKFYFQSRIKKYLDETKHIIISAQANSQIVEESTDNTLLKK
jgi:hypothetical protein